MTTGFAFELQATDGAARCGRLTLAHGSVETPVFMPVGTYGAVKTLTPEDLESLGAQIILGTVITVAAIVYLAAFRTN